MDIISYKDAKNKGLVFYFTGIPCKRGHAVKRWVVGRYCDKCRTDHHIVNKDHIRSVRAEWHKVHKKDIQAYSSKRYRENAERINKVIKIWKKEHRELLAYYCSKRRSAKLQATPCWVDQNKIKKIFLNRPIGMHVDHIIPLQSKNICGLEVPWNLQYLTPEENEAKANSFTPYIEFPNGQIEFIRE